MARGRISRGTRFGRQRAERRPGEGAGDAEQRRDRIKHARASSLSVQANSASATRAAELERDRRAGDPAAVDPVGGPAGHQRQQEQGHELDEADDAEPKRRFLQPHRLAGDVIDLPADDDDHRHLPDRRASAGPARNSGTPEFSSGSGSRLTARRLARRRLRRQPAPAGPPSRKRLISHGMVSPWTRIEKATTTKAVTMIALRSGTVGGTASASARASAPRSPPQNKSVLVGRREPPARRGRTAPPADRSTMRARRAPAGSRSPPAQPSCAQRQAGRVHPDQDEDEAVGEEREIFPRLAHAALALRPTAPRPSRCCRPSSPRPAR